MLLTIAVTVDVADLLKALCYCVFLYLPYFWRLTKTAPLIIPIGLRTCVLSFLRGFACDGVRLFAPFGQK